MAIRAINFRQKHKYRIPLLYFYGVAPIFVEGAIPIEVGVPLFRKANLMSLKIDDDLSTALGSVRISIWNSGGRPSSPRYGMIGYNITTHQLEIYNGTAWRVIDTTAL